MPNIDRVYEAINLDYSMLIKTYFVNSHLCSIHIVSY